ncbi:MAG: carbohydrate binding family 9 domain-containing protein [Acidobacteria bacterium]|nr:carbohydrate binding family 9 domain-containing protein [Acidobacteriota bacterium]
MPICNTAIIRTLYLAAVVLISCPALSAQPENNNGGSGTGSSAAQGGKVVVPPEKASPVRVPKTDTAVVIDGKLDEPVWQTAAVFKDFYQTAPGNNTAPSRPTEAYMFYDERHLYIGFKCWDEPDKVRATVARRDNVFGEDNVRVWLDTFNDQRRAYVLGFNPLGVQQDGIYTEGSGADFSVDVVMESKGVIEDWGWSVEVKIPFKSLRYSAGKGKMWGFNAARNIDRFNDEFDQWMPEDRNVSGFLIQHGKITGMDEIKYERTLEITPSITVSETGRRVPALEVVDGRFFNQPVKADIGLTLKYTISPNITLDAAFNPDFAEIEADAPVVTANQRFPIFFQEKRPFFLEGSDIFSTPITVFHSRTIVDPDVALKLTGKEGKNSFGVLFATDKAPGNFSEDERNDPSVRPRINEFLDKNAVFGILRAKRDIGKENHIGLFVTYRGFPEQKNLVASVDTRVKFTPKLTGTLQVAGTTSRRCFFDPSFEPDADPSQAARNREVCGTGNTSPNPLGNGSYDRYRTGNAVGYYGNLDYYTDRHGWFIEAGGRSADYRADAGFNSRSDSNFLFFYHRTSTRSRPNAPLIRASWGKFTGYDFDFSGRMQRFRAGSNLNLSLQRSIFLYMEGGVVREKIYEEEFGLKRMPTRPGRFVGDPVRDAWQQFFYTEMNHNLNKYLFYYVSVNYTNNRFDYFFPAGNGQIDPGPGKQFSANAEIEWKPINAWRASASYNKSRLVRNDNRIRSFDSDILSLRSTYSFSRFVFVRTRLDYDSMRDNFAGQALFGWTPSPGTAFYAGYNDNFNYNGRNPFSGDPETGFARNSRTFFIRVSYLFRKSF